MTATPDLQSPATDKRLKQFDHVTAEFDTGRRVLFIFVRVDYLAEIVNEAVAKRQVPRSPLVRYMADLEDALRVGKRLVADYGADTIGDDISVLDQEDRRAVRASIVPVAEHVNVDLAAEDLEVTTDG